MKILINEQVNKDEWNKFVYDNLKGNIFQTYEFYEIYKQTKNLEPVLIATKDDKEILCGLLAYISTEKPGIFSSLSRRAVIQGGPLYTTHGKNFLNTLMKKYDELVKKRVLFTQIRNLFDVSDIKDILEKEKYVYEPHLNFLIDLTKPKDKLFAQLKKARRNGITKAKRLGVVIEEVDDIQEIDGCYNMLKQTYSYAKLPLASIDFFKNAFSILHNKDMIKFFVAKLDENKIGIITPLLYKKMIYDWYAGASREHLKYCPNDILPWHCIEWGNKTKFDVFDFGGAGHPDRPYGVREFKRQFGGKEVNFGRYEKINQRLKYKIAKTGFEVWKKIKN